MSKQIPNYPFVRCQIPPDVAAIYADVSRALDWNKPAVYMAALCLLASMHTGREIYDMITNSLQQTALRDEEAKLDEALAVEDQEERDLREIEVDDLDLDQLVALAEEAAHAC